MSLLRRESRRDGTGPGGEAHLKRFGRVRPPRNSKPICSPARTQGVHFERWRHAYGCGKWFLAARCTATLEVFGTYPAQVSEPPADIIEKIKARGPVGRG